MIEYTARIRVRYAETDQMKFAHHSSYIIWFEFARIEFMRNVGIDYAQMEKDGYLLPVLEVKAGYKIPARFDEYLEIKTHIRDIPRARLQFDYKVINEKKQLICEGYSVHAFMNKQNRAIKPPKFFLETLKRYF